MIQSEMALVLLVSCYISHAEARNRAEQEEEMEGIMTLLEQLVHNARRQCGGR